MTKITKSELKKLIMEEVSKIQKVKQLEAKKSEIEKELKALNESVSTLEEDEASLIPAPRMMEQDGIPGAVPAASAPAAAPMDTANLEKELLRKVVLDPKAIQAMAATPGMMEEGFLDAVKGIFSKKETAKKLAPVVAQAAGIKSTEDFKNEAKMKDFIGKLLEKAGITSMVGGAGSYLGAAIFTAIKGSAAALVAANLPLAVGVALLGGLIALTAGTYMKSAAPVKR